MRPSFICAAKGYIVVARRWSAGNVPGDLDLIAWEGPMLCFVEVKTRTAHDIDTCRSRCRLATSGIPFATGPAIRPPVAAGDSPADVRFDVISVYLVPGKEKEFQHFEGSFGWSDRRDYEER
jgi:putative endonuclease